MTQNVKVILTHEVDKLGSVGDVVEVRPGYARNYLLPRLLATPWTKGSQGQIDRLKAAVAKLGVELDKHKIVIEQPIKAVGTYQLTVRLFEDVVAPLEVAVRPEK